MIEPVNVPILLDVELDEEGFDLDVEELEEYSAQIGSLITISEVYGGLPSGGNSGELLIKNSSEDYDAYWGTIKSGANIWWTGHRILISSTIPFVSKRYLQGRTDVQPEIEDAVIGREVGLEEGTPNTLYKITGITPLVYELERIGNIGENDYNQLLNKPQIDGVVLSSESTSSGLGLATASAVEAKYTKPSDGIPASDLAEGVIPIVHNVPAGGITGEVLTKVSDNDYDAIWSEIGEVLPVVSSNDYGKVLSVSSSGIWNTGRAIFLINISYDSNTNTYSANKTHTEIVNAIQHGMVVVATYSSNYYWYYGLSQSLSKVFAHINTRDNKQTIKFFIITLNNKWFYYEYDLGTYSKPSEGIPASDLAPGVIPEVHSVPSGGSVNQIIRKNSSTDFDASWCNDDIVVISSAQPSSSTNLLWVKSEAEETIQIPTMSDMEAALSTLQGLPSGGITGQLLMKRTSIDFDAEWISPANSAEQDNTRPITAGAVYTEIGNINALLATI